MCRSLCMKCMGVIMELNYAVGAGCGATVESVDPGDYTHD